MPAPYKEPSAETKLESGATSALGRDLRRHLRRYGPVLLDVLLVLGAFSFSYWFRFERLPRGVIWRQMLALLPFFVGAHLAANVVFGVYRFSWRLFGLREASRIALAVLSVSALAFVLRDRVLDPGVYGVIPVGVIALEGLLSLAAMAGVRAQTRVLFQYVERRACLHPRDPGRVLLIGAGRAGALAIRELRGRPDLGYEVVGLVDDDARKTGQLIDGVPVLGTTPMIEAIIEKTAATSLVLAIPSASRGQVKALVDRLSRTGLALQTVPSLSELLTGKLRISKLRPVRIEDLLGREEVPFDASQWAVIAGSMGGRKILVTGAGGSIGSELCRQLARLRPEALLMVENNENNLFDIDCEIRSTLGEAAVPCLVDVRCRERIEEIFERFRPDVVFHAAAFKHVPMMELHPADAILNNVEGTRVIAETADRFSCERFVMISTDKAVNPTNVMGASKRVAELVVQHLARGSQTRFGCVRFGNVLGSRGSVLHTFRRQIEAGGPITVTNAAISRYFMTIPEAVRLVIQAGAAGQGGEIFLLDMGEPVRILDMAKQMIRLSGLTPEEIPIEIVGLRPGEKMHEELLLADEGARPSSMEKIWLAPALKIDPARFEEDLRLLGVAARDADARGIRRHLMRMEIGYADADDVASKTDDIAPTARTIAEAAVLRPRLVPSSATVAPARAA